MIIINAKTKQTWNTTEHEPQVFGHFGYNITPGYIRGWCPPNYQVPAIPYEVEICSSFVMVCEMNDPQYKYGLITLYPN